MSLKTFHIFVIVLSIVLTLGFGVWCFSSEQPTSTENLIMGVISLAIGFALVVYGRWFLAKHKDIETS